MALSHDTVLKGLKQPAVLVDADGQVIAANEMGRKQMGLMGNAQKSFKDQLRKGRPFKLLLENDLVLKASLMEGRKSEFLVKWQSLSDPEVKLSLFQAVSKSVNSSLILEEIFEALGDVLSSFIPFDKAIIVILDETQNNTKVIVSMDSEGQADIRGDNNVFTGYDNIIAELLKRPHSKLLLAPLPQSILTQPDSQQAMVVPLVSKGLVIGCLGISGRYYAQSHVKLLEDISEQLVVAVENARLYWQTQSQAGREFLINQITKSIRQSLDIQKILETTVQEVGKVLGLSRCVIHYWQEQKSYSEQFEYVLPGVPAISSPAQMADFERKLFQQRADSTQQYNPFILNDCRNFEPGRGLFDKEEIKSLAVFPILLHDQDLVGTINLHQCDAYRSWLAEEIDLLNAIAEHVTVALYQASLFQEKENQRKQLEDTLKELQQTQMHLIQSEKMAVLGQFVAGIAHEVNTPLGTLVSNDDTVKRCLESMTVSDESSQKYRQSALDLLKINHMASERIQEIVKNLRNFARLDESDLKQADLHEGLDATLLLIDSSLRGKIAIVKQYGDIPLLECFPGLLNQVFMNLLINASHSIEMQGTITITTVYHQPSLTVEVSITDTGKGIAKEHLSRIFDPGFTTKGAGVGTGLGLALCYKIVEKHHGRITVESTVGQGTTVTVKLPIKHPQSQRL